MPYALDHSKRLEAALKILDSNTASLDKLESLGTLLKDFDPKLNQAIDRCKKIISNIKKIQSGDLIELGVENLPGNDEKEKKRKKLILLLLKNWRELKSEVKRLNKELTNQPDASNYGRIIKFAKGPFGLVTLAALVIVGVSILSFNKKTQKPEQIIVPTSQKAKIKVIEFKEKNIPLDQLHIGQGPDCGGGIPTPHYHAKNGVSVTAIDGTIIPDPGSCGYGKVSETQIIFY